VALLHDTERFATCLRLGLTAALRPVSANGPEKLEAHGHADFTGTDTWCASVTGATLDFATDDHGGRVVRRTREDFAVRGSASFVLGRGSTAWPEHLPLYEAIAVRF
jgi:hypothetical protein